jgi:WD40 repeat protein
MTAGPTLGSPYRGLAPFGETELDGLLFFGRERETEVLTAHLIASRLTVLYGPSGVGKSSLLRAGVARRVRELAAHRAVGRGPDLACVVFASWADEPAARLAEAIGDSVAPLVSPTAPGPPPGSTLADVAEHWSAILDGDLCLVLDQLEEYFVYSEDGALVDELPGLLTRPGLRANVLLSVRDDQLARLGALKNAVPQIFANSRRLDRLDRDSARAAILGPLERWNALEGESVDIEPELVDAVLAQTATGDDVGRIEAPYLQLVLERVWNEETARGSRLLRESTLDELGGAEAIVREHLDRALSVLDLEQQESAARMFEHLVTPSGTKIAHRAADLATFARVDPEHGTDILTALSRERIVRPLDDSDGAPGRYEIFHDVLAQAILDWSHRRDVLRERLAARRRQRRLLGVVAAALVALAVMAGVTVYALAQRSDARAQTAHARAAALSADALAALPVDPELSLLLARDAARRDHTAAVEDVLRTALLDSRVRAVLRGHQDGVLAAGFSAGHVVTIDGRGTLRTFPAHTSPPLATRALGGRIRAAAFAANGSALAVARRRLVEVRALAPATRSFGFRVRTPVRALALDGRADRVAVATLDGRVTVRGPSGTVFTVRAPFGGVSTLALDETGDVVAAAGGDTAAVWRVGRRTPVARVRHADITGVALPGDGSLLATASADGAARVWNVPGGRLEGVFVTSESLTGVAFSPDGQVLVTTSRPGIVRTFDVAGGRPVAVLAGHSDAVTTAAFSRGGALLVTGSDDGTARLWDPGVAADLRVLARPAGCCTALVTGAAGTLVAAGRKAILYRGARVAATYRQPAPPTAVALAGTTVVTGGADGRVRIWSSPGSAPRTLDAAGPVTAVAANAADVVAATRSGDVTVWTTDGVGLLSFRERSSVAGLAISHDGRLLATAGVDRIARIRELGTGKLLHELTGHTNPLTAVAFSPDDSLLATSSFDHDVRTWNVATGTLAHRLRAHFAVVSDVAFSPDGRWLVTAGPTTAGLWQAGSGTFLTYLRGHTARLVGAGFTADGTGIVTASVDGTVRGYRCRLCGGLEALARLADARLAATGRQLTAAERRRYLAFR